MKTKEQIWQTYRACVDRFVEVQSNPKVTEAEFKAALKAVQIAEAEFNEVNKAA